MQQQTSKKILIVGDNLCDKFNFKESSQFILNKLGYDIILYSNSINAIELIEIEQPDLVLMDIYMKYKNGLELLEEVKTIESLSNIPFIMMTSLKHSRKLVDALEKGAFDYIIKNGMTSYVLSQKINKAFSFQRYTPKAIVA